MDGLAISVISSVLQAEPSSYATIFETKLPQKILGMIENRDYPHIEGLGAVANSLTSIAIHEMGVQAIVSANSFQHLLHSVTPEKCGKLREGDLIMTGAIFNELFRHHASLRPAGISACYEFIKALLEYGERAAGSEKKQALFLEFLAQVGTVRACARALSLSLSLALAL